MLLDQLTLLVMQTEHVHATLVTLELSVMNVTWAITEIDLIVLVRLFFLGTYKCNPLEKKMFI